MKNCINCKYGEVNKEGCFVCCNLPLKKRPCCSFDKWENDIVDNIVKAIPLSEIDSFTLKIMPDEKWLKIIYKEGFILEDIVMDNYYKFTRYNKSGLWRT